MSSCDSCAIFLRTILLSKARKGAAVSAIAGFSITTVSATFYSVQQPGNAQPVGLATSPTQSADASGSTAGTGQDSASISGPGQLYGNLQKLLAKDPDKFKQVVTQIANQLQSAAQQEGQDPVGQFLSKLADKFQNVANGGDLSRLQPHRHGHHAHQTYNQNGRYVPHPMPAQTGDYVPQLLPAQAGGYVPQPLPATSPNSPDPSSSGTDIRQLFASIANEVSQALGS